MEEGYHDPAVEAGEEARQRPLGDDVRALLESGLALAQAEVGLQQARASYAAGKVRAIAVLGLFVLLLASLAMVALTVGLVVGLMPLIGPFGATFAVFGGLVLAALACALWARSLWTRMMAALSNRSAD